jgi:hypothetical protein
MTTPTERTRALIQTREFLQYLAAHEQSGTSPERMCQEALRLLRHYPRDPELMLLNKAFPHLFASPNEALG